MAGTLWASVVRVPYYNDAMREALDDAGIRETFQETNPEPETSAPTHVRVITPGANDVQARAHIFSALHEFGVRIDDVRACALVAHAYFVNGS